MFVFHAVLNGTTDYGGMNIVNLYGVSHNEYYYRCVSLDVFVYTLCSKTVGTHEGFYVSAHVRSAAVLCWD